MLKEIIKIITGILILQVLSGCAISTSEVITRTNVDEIRQVGKISEFSWIHYICGIYYEWAIDSISFSPDSRLLAGAGPRQQIWIWDARTLSRIATLRYPIGSEEGILAVEFSPSRILLASSGVDFYKNEVGDFVDTDIKLWDVKTKRKVIDFDGSISGFCLAFSPDGAILAASHSWGHAPIDRRLSFYDVKEGKEVFAIETHSYELSALTFSPDGKFLATAGVESTDSGYTYDIKLWKVAGRKVEPLAVVRRAHVNGVSALALVFSPDGTLLASGDGGVIKLWRVDTSSAPPGLKEVASWQAYDGEQPDYLRSVESLAFNLDGTLLISAGQDYVKLWDVKTCQELKRLKVPDVICVRCRPDGKVIAASNHWSEVYFFGIP